MPLNRIKEIGLIDSIKKRIKNSSGVVCGVGDDAAVLRYTRDKYLLFCADMLMEGIDFAKDTPAERVGYKAMACSLSDIAAMGGYPKYALISLAIEKRNARGFIRGFYKGLLTLAKEFKVDVVGGDLSQGEKTVIDVSLIGEVKAKNLTLRSTAALGDIIFVSGSLGGSIKGRHLSFIPRLKEARYLVNNYKVSAMMDISDGLSLDLYRLCQASKTGAVIFEELIPVSNAADSFEDALNMGEDFELLFTLPLKDARRLIRRAKERFKAIGEVVDKKQGLKIIRADFTCARLIPKGYRHF